MATWWFCDVNFLKKSAYYAHIMLNAFAYRDSWTIIRTWDNCLCKDNWQVFQLWCLLSVLRHTIIILLRTFHYIESVTISANNLCHWEHLSRSRCWNSQEQQDQYNTYYAHFNAGIIQASLPPTFPLLAVCFFLFFLVGLFFFVFFCFLFAVFFLLFLFFFCVLFYTWVM